MMPVHRATADDVLDPEDITWLRSAQDRADALTPMDPRIQGKWDYFRTVEAWPRVRTALEQTFCFKCAYCECALKKADVEHFWPKSLAPERMFRWDNFLWVCKSCNTDKLDDFPIHDGEAVLIDPCAEDPFRFFGWDMLTGKLHPSDHFEHRTRALETRKAFDLDHQTWRDERLKARDDLLFFVARAIEEAPLSVETHERIRCALEPKRPWRSILRQVAREEPNVRLFLAAKAKHPELAALFEGLEVPLHHPSHPPQRD
ncbi:MAG: hypothetical protein H6741_08925 [Alphaproteobacteria bacterium]|nr:hypothetical protein [Alphaproteobacteria bacterium]MCB9792836.1 hypothetical protein [Alphaproteobacteria bacterium]